MGYLLFWRGGGGIEKGHQVRLGSIRLDCLTPTLQENASLHDLIKDSQKKIRLIATESRPKIYLKLLRTSLFAIVSKPC